MPVFAHQLPPYKDVVIIGNGPSGICLSYFLSGYRPYYNGKPHSNPILAEKLKKLGPNDSIIDQELKYLSKGLEGRSSNPVALLFDALSHPDADLGVDKPSVLEWRQESQNAIDHIVLGKLRPGGSWQKMDGTMQTLSRSSWMDLPDLPFQDWVSKNRRMDDLAEPCMKNRARITDVYKYYMSFVEEKHLRDNFCDCTTVTSVQKVYKNQEVGEDESDEPDSCFPTMKKQPYYWNVRGFCSISGSPSDVVEQEPTREEFCISALSVVIATGSFEIPNKLGVAGENLPYLSHSLHEFESVIKNKQLSKSPYPALIVGAGFSAADAVLMALQSQVSVVHAFRRAANDSSLCLKDLPEIMYPDYHKVHSLMKGTILSPLYKPFPQQDILEFKEDKIVSLKPCSKSVEEITTIEVSHACVLIGALPDLSFLPCGGRDLGVLKGYPVLLSKHNVISIDPYSYQSVQEPGLFAMGPLVGDNFVRFGLGGALGITHCLLSKNKQLV